MGAFEHTLDARILSTTGTCFCLVAPLLLPCSALSQSLSLIPPWLPMLMPPPLWRPIGTRWEGRTRNQLESTPLAAMKRRRVKRALALKQQRHIFVPQCHCRRGRIGAEFGPMSKRHPPIAVWIWKAQLHHPPSTVWIWQARNLSCPMWNPWPKWG